MRALRCRPARAGRQDPAAGLALPRSSALQSLGTAFPHKQALMLIQAARRWLARTWDDPFRKYAEGHRLAAAAVYYRRPGRRRLPADSECPPPLWATCRAENERGTMLDAPGYHMSGICTLVTMLPWLPGAQQEWEECGVQGGGRPRGAAPWPLALPNHHHHPLRRCRPARRGQGQRHATHFPPGDHLCGSQRAGVPQATPVRAPPGGHRCGRAVVRRVVACQNG